MKNKIAVLFSLTVIFCCFYFVQPALAATFTQILNSNSDVVVCTRVDGNGNTYYRTGAVNYGLYLYVTNNSVHTNSGYSISYWDSSFNPINNPNTNMTNYSYTYGFDFVKCIKIQGTHFDVNVTNGSYFGSVEEYNESLIPPWYVQLWDDFKDFVSDLGVALLTPFDPNSIIDIADWFENAWTVKVGEGEDDLLNQIEVVTPTPTPVPPTPIPYQTIIVPDGNGGSIIQYKYLNPSGTPIITDQPPQQNVTVNYDNDNNFEYPYYENPDNKDNPFKFKIPWYLKLVLRNNDIDIDTLDDHYEVAQNQVQSEDVVNSVNEVYNGFQVLPTDWLLLLGAIASLPLFAALIHRFLQG